MTTTIRLSEPPPSLNNLFANAGAKGRVKTAGYRMWLQAAGWELIEQRPRSVSGPVSIALEVGPSACDLDNHAKGALDLLARHRVISDDGPTVVREIVLRRVEPRGVCITISALKPAQEARAA